MNTNEALKQSLDMGEMVSMMYLEDLTDEEMMHRPAEGANHINWQLGHLISSEHGLVNMVVPGVMPELPEGFSEKYAKETVSIDDLGAFFSKAELLQTYRQQRDGALQALQSLSDEDFDKASGFDYAPTVGSLFSMLGSHFLMHAGQWAVTRRQLGRPALF